MQQETDMEDLIFYRFPSGNTVAGIQQQLSRVTLSDIRGGISSHFRHSHPELLPNIVFLPESAINQFNTKAMAVVEVRLSGDMVNDITAVRQVRVPVEDKTFDEVRGWNVHHSGLEWYDGKVSASIDFVFRDNTVCTCELECLGIDVIVMKTADDEVRVLLKNKKDIGNHITSVASVHLHGNNYQADGRTQIIMHRSLPISFAVTETIDRIADRYTDGREYNDPFAYMVPLVPDDAAIRGTVFNCATRIEAPDDEPTYRIMFVFVVNRARGLFDAADAADAAAANE